MCCPTMQHEITGCYSWMIESVMKLKQRETTIAKWMMRWCGEWPVFNVLWHWKYGLSGKLGTTQIKDH